MSCLTTVLQVLQVLTTLSGCNIYQYIEGERRPFQLNQNLYRIVGALHRFWLRPWLIFMFLRHLINLLLDFLVGLSEYSANNKISVNLVYKVESVAIMYQNFIISVAIYYNYRYRIDRLKLMLDEFYTMYHQYSQICGQKVKINWLHTLLPTIRMINCSVLPLTFPMIVNFGQLKFLMEISALLFLCIQPLLLSLVATMGFLIIYGFYGIQYKTSPEKKVLLFSFYRNLIKLRQDFDQFLRPFVWAGLLECFTVFASAYHMELYDQHLVHKFFQNLFLISLWPLNFFYITTSISEMERKFGCLRFNSRPQRQHQLFWLYRQVMIIAVDQNIFNVFRPDRKMLLEMLNLGWVIAMFTNSLLVNSKAGKIL